MSRGLRHEDDGAIAVLVAIFAVVMFGLAAVVVDLGLVRVTASDAQSVADSAALAGADALFVGAMGPDYPAAIAAVKASVAGNQPMDPGPPDEWATCTTPLPKAGWSQQGSGTDCIMFDSLPRRVRVVTPSRRVDAAFGGILGYSGSDVSRTAQAQARDHAIQDCSLCVSADLSAGDDSVVTVRGDGSLIADRGLVSASDVRVTVEGGSLAFAQFPPNPGPASPVWSPEPVQAPTDDPFAGRLVLPGVPALAGDDTDCPGGPVVTDVSHRRLTISGNCEVSGGPLVVTDSLVVEDGATLTGDGTTVLLGCARDGSGGPGSDAVVSCALPHDSEGRLVIGGVLDLFSGSVQVDTRRLSIVSEPGNDRTSSVSGRVSVRGGSIYSPEADLSVSGFVIVNEGLVSLQDLRVSGAGVVDVTANGLGPGPGPFRLALVK